MTLTFDVPLAWQAGPIRNYCVTKGARTLKNATGSAEGRLDTKGRLKDCCFAQTKTKAPLKSKVFAELRWRLRKKGPNTEDLRFAWEEACSRSYYLKDRSQLGYEVRRKAEGSDEGMLAEGYSLQYSVEGSVKGTLKDLPKGTLNAEWRLIDRVFARTKMKPPPKTQVFAEQRWRLRERGICEMWRKKRKILFSKGTWKEKVQGTRYTNGLITTQTSRFFNHMVTHTVPFKPPQVLKNQNNWTVG